MKKIVALLLALAALFCLCACGEKEPVETTEGLPDYTASQAEIDKLEKLYEGRIPLHGEFHNHAAIKLSLLNKCSSSSDRVQAK